MKTIEFSLRVALKAQEMINDVIYLSKYLTQTSTNVYTWVDEDVEDDLLFWLEECGIGKEEYKIYIY